MKRVSLQPSAFHAPQSSYSPIPISTTQENAIAQWQCIHIFIIWSPGFIEEANVIFIILMSKFHAKVLKSWFRADALNICWAVSFTTCGNDEMPFLSVDFPLTSNLLLPCPYYSMLFSATHRPACWIPACSFETEQTWKHLTGYRDTAVAFYEIHILEASNSFNTSFASSMPLFPNPPITVVDSPFHRPSCPHPYSCFVSHPSGGAGFRANLLLPFLFRCFPSGFASVHPFCPLTDFWWQTLHAWSLLA